MKEFPPFYIGQRVVCIDIFSKIFTLYMVSDVLIKDEKYIINGIRKSCCSWEVDVGFTSRAVGHRCSQCENVVPTTDGIWWFRANRFVSIEELFEHITYKAVLKKEEKLIGVN